MLLTIAGVKKEVKDGITIDELIESENVESPLYVSVSVNDEIAQREEFAVRQLSDGDVIEFLYFMGGGCC